MNPLTPPASPRSVVVASIWRVMVGTWLPPRAGRWLGRVRPAWTRCGIILTGLLWSASPLAAQADQLLDPAALKQMSVEELLAQEVTSVARRAEPWRRAPSSIFVITPSMARHTGATRLVELLRRSPTLYVGQYNSGMWAVNSRGFIRTTSYSNKLLLLVDGRTAYSPFFSNVFWDSTDVFLPDLERIEIISGPAGATWGSNAVNGVINVQTKSAHQTQGALYYAGVGTSEEASFGVRHGVPVGETGALRVFAQAARFDATRDRDGRRDNSDPGQLLRGGFRADWVLRSDAELTLQGEVYQSRFNRGPDPAEKSDGANVLLRWKQANGNGRWSAQLYHDYVWRDVRQLYVARTHTTDLEIQHQFALGERHEFIWGANYRHINDAVSRTVGYVLLPRQLDFALGSLFAQHEVTSSNSDWRLTSGLRVEHNHFSGWESQPHVRLAWRPDPAHTLWASVARSTRTPSRLETGYFAPVQPPHHTAADPHLRSEILEAAELGWRSLLRPNLALTTTLFEHRYDFLVTIEPTPVVANQVSNAAAGRSRGIEAFMEWDVTSWWRLRAGGFVIDQDTWVRRGRYDHNLAMSEVSFPAHQGQLQNTFWMGDRLTLWFGLRRVAKVTAFEGRRFVDPVPAYTELDARIGWRVRPGFEVSVKGLGLLNDSHPEFGGAARREIPRSFHLLLQWEY
jgi:iron complex outermembrane recepter protein